MILLGFGQLGCTLRSSQKMPLTVTLLPGHDLAEEWERKESFLCAERCVCVTRCPRIILTQRRAGKCFWVLFFFFISSPCGAPPAQVGPVEWGACSRAGRGRAGRTASRRPQPLSPTLLPGASSSERPPASHDRSSRPSPAAVGAASDGPLRAGEREPTGADRVGDR